MSWCLLDNGDLQVSNTSSQHLGTTPSLHSKSRIWAKRQDSPLTRKTCPDAEFHAQCIFKVASAKASQRFQLSELIKLNCKVTSTRPEFCCIIRYQITDQPPDRIMSGSPTQLCIYAYYTIAALRGEHNKPNHFLHYSIYIYIAATYNSIVFSFQCSYEIYSGDPDVATKLRKLDVFLIIFHINPIIDDLPFI